MWELVKPQSSPYPLRGRESTEAKMCLFFTKKHSRMWGQVWIWAPQKSGTPQSTMRNQSRTNYEKTSSIWLKVCVYWFYIIFYEALKTIILWDAANVDSHCMPWLRCMNQVVWVGMDILWPEKEKHFWEALRSAYESRSGKNSGLRKHVLLKFGIWAKGQR